MKFRFSYYSEHDVYVAFRYPHLKSLDFWMTGESYAGHYIPQLATKVLEYNQGATGADVINLKGLMIGEQIFCDIANGAFTTSWVIWAFGYVFESIFSR